MASVKRQQRQKVKHSYAGAYQTKKVNVVNQRLLRNNPITKRYDTNWPHKALGADKSPNQTL
ncbi:hypothetical protein ES703_115724 [subsurface metagenome]